MLLIAGEGPERAGLERLAAAVAPGRVKFLGQWLQSPGFMASLDLFVLPSRWEGMPNVLLEAMAAGVPVVAAAVGGVPEMVVSGAGKDRAAGETGLLLAPDDPGALARAMALLLRDPDRLRAMGEAARARAAEFSIERMVDGYQRLYDELAGAGGVL